MKVQSSNARDGNEIICYLDLIFFKRLYLLRRFEKWKESRFKSHEKLLVPIDPESSKNVAIALNGF